MDTRGFKGFPDHPVWSTSSGPSLDGAESLWDDDWPNISEFLTAESLTGLSDVDLGDPWTFSTSGLGDPTKPASSSLAVTPGDERQIIDQSVREAQELLCLTRVDDDTSMRGQLQSAIHSTEGDKANRFLPLSALDNIVNYDAVSLELRLHFPRLSTSSVDMYAARICAGNPMAVSPTSEQQSCRRLFAILSLMQQLESLISLVDEGVTDLDLPVWKTAAFNGMSLTYELRGKHTHNTSNPISACRNWSSSQVELFEKIQWLVCSPVFSEGSDGDTRVGFLELEDSVVLPWRSTTEHLERVRGSSCHVFRCVPEPSHFKSTSCSTAAVPPTLAIKQLNSGNKEDFDHEVEILQKFRPKNHPHIVRLTSTYRHKGKYHLLFPSADMNLREYWRKNPKPNPDVPTTRWVVSESKGIVSGLLLIHNGGRRDCDNGYAWCSHRDLKPDNILLFPNSASTSFGTWKLADFGLSEYHEGDKVIGRSNGCTSTYRPPEYDIDKTLGNRAGDIWALACMFLECLTWLLEGWNGLVEFAKHRSTQIRPGVFFDEYFETLDDYGARRAILKPCIIAWSAYLYRHKDSSALVRDFLDFIVRRMFVIESKDRATCGMVFVRIDEMSRKCFDLVSYCIPSSSGEPPWMLQQGFSTTSIRESIRPGTSVVSNRNIPAPARDTVAVIAIEGGEALQAASTSLGPHGLLTNPTKQLEEGVRLSSHEKRKRSGSQESGGKRGASRRAMKKHLSLSDEPAGQDKRFACPFYKNNPRKFRKWRTCGGPGWPEVHRMKEHLYRRHTIGKYTCRRCLLCCEDAEGLADHQRATEPCTKTDAFPEGMMSAGQEQALRQKKRTPPHAAEEQWFEIYKILFPEGDPEASFSPYYEDENIPKTQGTLSNLANQDLSEFKKYLSSDLPLEVQQHMEQEIRRELDLPLRGQSRKVVHLVPRLLLGLFETYEESRRVVSLLDDRK